MSDQRPKRDTMSIEEATDLQHVGDGRDWGGA